MNEDDRGIFRVVTHGTFELDGGSWEVDNNIWLVGDEREVVAIDAAHDAAQILDADAVLRVDGVELRAVHTLGHSPGSTCLYAPVLDAVFSGDTLFRGGPGATGRSYWDFPTILSSISQRLGKLREHTTVYTGHGESTTIGDELAHYDEWVARGH